MTHPQLVKIETLVRRLVEAMEQPDEGSEKTLFSSAAEYAEHCKRANDRLQVCAEIASKGKEMEYQALMTATRAPDLLDLCATLSELQTEEWRAFCRQHHLPLAEPLNEVAKQLIDPIYARAGTFQRKLMEEYSAANSKRDFREALRIIRQVSVLNPSDANSATQAQRLEDRLVRELVKTLEEPLRNGDSNVVLERLDEIEALAPGRAPKPDEASEAAWIAATELRRSLRRDEAIEDCADLMAEAESAWHDGSLEEVLGLISRVSALMEEHEFTLRPNLRELHAEIGRWADEEVKKLKIEDRFRSKLNGLKEEMRGIRDKELQSQKPTLEEYREDSFLIQRLWKEIAEFRKPVAPELMEEAQKLLGELNERVAQLEKAKRRAVILAVGAATIVLAVCSVIAVFFWKAKETRDQVSRSIADRRANDLQRRIADLEGNRPIWFIFSGLPGEIEKGKSWLEIERSNADRVGALVSGIDGEMRAVPDPGQWTSPALASLKTRIEEAKAGAGEINEDFRSDLSDKLAAIEGEWKRVASAKRDLVNREFRSNLELLDKKLNEELKLDQPPSKLQKAVEETSRIVAELEALAAAELDELKPSPPTLITSFELRKGKFAEIEAKVNQAGTVMTSSREAETLEKYLTAVGGLNEAGVLSGSQAVAHGRMLAKVRSEESVLKEIITPGDVALWTRLSGGSFTEQGHPETPEGDEVVQFLTLRDDENLGEIYRYPLSEASRSRTIYSLGQEMKIRNSRVGDVEITEAEGEKVFDPARLTGTEVVFAPFKQVHRKSSVGVSGLHVGEGSRCPESVLSGKIRLASFADASVTSYRDTLLKAVDRILESDASASPLFKAYLHLKIGELMMARKDAWLIGFTDFEEDYMELRKIVDRDLTSSDWLVPSLDRDYREALASYYSARSSTRYAATGLAVYRVYKRLIAGGLGYVGFVDLKDGLELVNPDEGASTLWGCDKGMKIAELFRREPDGTWVASAEPAPFTPVFSFKSDPGKVLAEVSAATGADPADPEILGRLPKALYPDSK